MSLAEDILNIIINYFSLSIIVLLLYIFIVGKPDFIKHNRIKSVLYIIVYVFSGLLVEIFIPPSFHALFYVIICTLTLSFVTKSDIYISLIASIITVVLFSVIDVLSAILLMLLLNCDMHMIMKSAKLKLYGGVISQIIEFIIIYLIYKSNVKLLNLRKLEKKSYLTSSGLIHIFIINLAIAIIFLGIYFANKSLVSQLISLILWILILIISFIDFFKRDKVLKTNYQLKLQKTNVANMEKVISILRKNHHDIGNHLNTILAIARMRENDALDRIEEYIGSLTHELKDTYKSYNTGNEFISGLFAVKNNHAFERGIRFEVDFEAKLDLIDISDHALISILSNIIDNAFQAIENDPVKSGKFISVSGYEEKDKYLLSICNNGPSIPRQSLNKIFENGYSTKENKDKEHGFGLFIAKKHVTENAGEISISSSEEETEFLIAFPCKK